MGGLIVQLSHRCAFRPNLGVKARKAGDMPTNVNPRPR